MANSRDVAAMITYISESKMVDLNAVTSSLASLLGKVPDGSLVGWYALGGDHFVIVCGANPGQINELTAAVPAARVAIER